MADSMSVGSGGGLRLTSCVVSDYTGPIRWMSAFALARRAPVPFTDRQVDLVRTFADQAVIAMCSARTLGSSTMRTKSPRSGT